MISIADGRIPVATIVDTASPASSIVRNAASCVTTTSGCRTIRSVTSTAIPSVPSEPMIVPEQVGPVVAVHRLAAELEQLAVGEDHLRPGDVVDGEPVLEAVRAARVLGDVAADGADLLARRVGGVEEPVGRDGACDREIRHARLDDDPLAREIDLEDPVHPCDRDDDPLRHGQRAARETGAGTARDERDALAGAEAQHRPHLVGRARQDDTRRLRAPAREPVALVGRQVLRLRQHVGCTDRSFELVHQSGRKGHRRDPTSAGPSKASIIDDCVRVTP